MRWGSRSGYALKTTRIQVYQNKPTNVLAELVSNSWDAEANKVWIHLRTNGVGEPSSIIVADDGVGMDEAILKNT